MALLSLGAALLCGRMHKPPFSQGLSSFFQRLPHRFGTDALYHLAFNEPVRHQFKRPTYPAMWRFGAGQGNQVGFPFTVQFLLAAGKPLLAPQSCLNTFLTQRRPTRSTVTQPIRRDRAISSSFIARLPWASSLSSKMRAWVCRYAAARPRDTRAFIPQYLSTDLRHILIHGRPRRQRFRPGTLLKSSRILVI